MGLNPELRTIVGSPLCGPFGRIKVADLAPTFESKQVGDSDPLLKALPTYWSWPFSKYPAETWIFTAL